MSGERLRRLPPYTLSPEQRALYDAIAGGPRAAGPQLFALTDADGCLNGPFNAMLLSPQVGDALQQLGAAIRYQTGLSARVREMAILLVAAAWDSAFERYSHEPVARAVGVSEPEIRALRAGRPPPVDDVTEAACLRLVATLVQQHDVDDDIYRDVTGVMGEPAVFELSALVGYYATLALQMRVFRVGTPNGRAGVDDTGYGPDTAGHPG